jgi:hypothetical protein
MSKKLRTEIEIDAPAEKVWEVLTDFNRYEEWNPFIIKSKGEVREGAILINVMKNGEKTMTFRPRILEVRENEYFDWRGSLFFRGLFDGHHYFRIEDRGNNGVKLIHGEKFSGILSGPIFKSIRENTLESFRSMNEALKKRCESVD